MGEPIVSIICLCYNQAPYVQACLQSVITQSYPHIQIIVVDDASTDGSKEIIRQTISQWDAALQERTIFVDLEENVGNCQAFNHGLAKAEGAYVIDLAADDCLKEHRVEEQLNLFDRLDESYGVIYTDAEYIDLAGDMLRTLKVDRPVEGDIYTEVVSRYFIPPPTMMMKRWVLDKLGGYDKQLAYEDFDFWVRSARLCRYAYLPKSLTQIRRVPGSLSTRFHEKDSPLAKSTYLVCEKIFSMNKTADEQQALARRIRYERMQCALLGNRQVARDFGRLLQRVDRHRAVDIIPTLLIMTPLRWQWLLRVRHRLRGSLGS